MAGMPTRRGPHRLEVCALGPWLARLGLVTFATLTVAASWAANAPAATFFLFNRTGAKPNDLVTIRSGGTPRDFKASERIKPFYRPIRLYLVVDTAAGDVRSRFDRRLHFVGRLVADKNGRGVLTFALPPFDSGRYVMAFWCAWCASHSRGRTFFVQEVNRDIVPRYRPQMRLRVTMPPAAATCPVTRPSDGTPRGLAPDRWYGNGLLWTSLPRDGVLVPMRDLSWKFGWLPTGIAGTMTVEGGDSMRGRRRFGSSASTGATRRPDGVRGRARSCSRAQGAGG